ncbi:MAG: hypothetical protein HQ517_17825 [SAR324 cluster bacterium]|nr:hypothetical protein [SAR324 cluster bacterium]
MNRLSRLSKKTHINLSGLALVSTLTAWHSITFFRSTRF